MNQVTTALTPAQIAAMEPNGSKEAALVAEAQQQTTGEPQQAPAPAPKAAVNFTTNDGRAKTIKLQWPVIVDGKQLEEVTIRRLTGRDYKVLASLPDGADENAALLAMMIGLPADVIEGFDADDYAEIAGGARDFLPRDLRTAIERASQTGAQSPQ